MALSHDPTWWGLTAGAWATIAAWLTLAVLTGTAVIALRQLRDARRLSEAESRPWVVVDLDLDKHPHMIHIYFENFGKTVARNVRLSFEPPLQSTLGDRRIDFLDHTFPTLPPNKRIDTFFDSAVAVMAPGATLPRRYEVTVTYEDRNGKAYSDRYVLDIEAFRNRHFVGVKDLNDLVKAVESLATLLGRVVSRDAMNVTTQTVEERREEEQEWLQSRQAGPAGSPELGSTRPWAKWLSRLWRSGTTGLR